MKGMGQGIILLLLAAVAAGYAPLLSGTCAMTQPPPKQDGRSIYSRLERVAPPGFSWSRPPQLYGTEERRLQDGSIFTYMDGGGIAYLERGFVELFHGEFSDQGKNTISLDVFLMTSAQQALGALTDGRICPAGGSPLPFAPQGKAYRFPPDYFLYFAVNNRLVYLHVNNDLLGEILDRFAIEVRSIIEKEEP
jgi:hypothetical protein